MAATDFKLPPEVIKHLTRRSDTKGMVQLGAHLGLLLLTGVALGQSWHSWWLLLTLPVYSAVLIFLFAPEKKLSQLHAHLLMPSGSIYLRIEQSSACKRQATDNGHDLGYKQSNLKEHFASFLIGRF